jgi:hypothetical protein
MKSLARDYAVVARIHDQVSGRPVIILAGILGEGTEAASEVVSNPADLDAMLQKAPKNWVQLNLEAVIEANVIEGHPWTANGCCCGDVVRRFHTEKLYHTSLKTAPRSFPIELQI